MDYDAKICMVLTTINKGDILEGYCRQAELDGVSRQLTIIVIADRKSPTELYGRCEVLRKKGFDIVCPAINEQEQFLKHLGLPTSFIPYDSDNRRNIGFLMALERRCDVLVSFDDDNYCIAGCDVFGDYSIVNGGSVTLEAVYEREGWFNTCSMLNMDPVYKVYPRGFPYYARHRESPVIFKEESRPVRLNVGLWLGDPDLDAITWLAAPVCVKSFQGKSFLLGSKVWSPINTQNTSLHRDLIAAYYFIRMGYSIAGMPIDRYGDIFSGYFCQACMQHFGDRIRIGTPVSFHRRNYHNYLKDLTQELACIWMIEDLTKWLWEVKLQGSSYIEAYLSLADALDNQVDKFKGFIWTSEARDYFHQVAADMRQWGAACRRIS